jgi:hypothetical protein
MKNIIICGLLSLSVLVVNCNKKDNIPDCCCEGKTYSVLSNAEGTVDSLGLGTIIIFLADQPNMAVSPCNLSDSIINLFSKDSLKVIISGEIKDVCPNWHIVGAPIVISKIEMISDSK